MLLWVVFWVVLVGIILLFLAFLTIEVMVHYKRDAVDDRIELKFQVLGGLVHYRLEVPMAKLIKQNDSSMPHFIAPVKAGVNQTSKVGLMSLNWDQVEQMLDTFKDFWRRIGVFKEHVLKQFKIFRIYEFRWKTEFGLGDAAATGTLAGLAWAIKGGVVGIASHFFNLQERPHLEIKPVFYVLGFSTDITCIIRFRLGEAMIAGTKVAIYWLRRDDHGAPNRRFNANRYGES